MKKLFAYLAVFGMMSFGSVAMAQDETAAPESDDNINKKDSTGEEECEACKIDYDTIDKKAANSSEQSSSNVKTSDDDGTRLVMVTTTTCPNCKLAKEKLNKYGFKYDEVYADKDPEYAKKYNVRQAPTLLILKGDEEIERFTSLGNISRYVKDHI